MDEKDRMFFAECLNELLEDARAIWMDEPFGTSEKIEEIISVLQNKFDIKRRI